MIGRTYLERGQPVVVLKRWRHATGQLHYASLACTRLAPSIGPRNVLIQRQDGSRVVRPFRGLRKTEEAKP